MTTTSEPDPPYRTKFPGDGTTAHIPDVFYTDADEAPTDWSAQEIEAALRRHYEDRGGAMLIRYQSGEWAENAVSTVDDVNVAVVAAIVRMGFPVPADPIVRAGDGVTFSDLQGLGEAVYVRRGGVDVGTWSRFAYEARTGEVG